MGQTTSTYYDQALRARITNVSVPTYWYAAMNGEKFEVRRNPGGIKLVESESEKIRARLNDNPDTTYYIAEEDCRLIRI